jgi:hypothetical protein
LFKRLSGSLGAAALDDFSAQAETPVLQFQRPDNSAFTGGKGAQRISRPSERYDSLYLYTFLR